MKGKLGRRGAIALVIMMLLGGAATAAVLDYYGEITGTADVEQAILLDSQTQADGPISYDFNTNPAGKTYIEQHNLTSTADVEATVNFETRGNGVGQGWQGPTTLMDIDWGGGMKGVDTRYVEVFDDAGASFDDYSSPTSGTTVSTFAELDDNVTDGTDETIIVAPGTYTGDLTVTDGDTIVAQNSPVSSSNATIEGEITVKASGATVKGLRISPGTGSKLIALFVKTGSDVSNVDIDSNVFESFESTGTTKAIHVKSFDPNHISNVVIDNNLILGVNSTDGAGGYGIMLQANVSDVTVTNNTVENLDGGWTKALGITYSNLQSGHPSNVDVKWNDFEDMLGLDDVPGGEVSVSYNNFDGDGTDLSNINSGQDTYPDEDLVANDNWFGTNGIQTSTAHNLPMNAGITASYMTKSDLTLEPGEVDEFGIINDFATNLKPGPYTVETKITPD